MKVNYLVCVAIGCLSVMPFMVHTLPVSSTEAEGVPTKLGEDIGFQQPPQQPHGELLAKGTKKTEDRDKQDMQMAADNSGYYRLEKDHDKIKLRMFPDVHRTAATTQLLNKWSELSTARALRTKGLLNFWAKDITTKAAPKKQDDQVQVRAGEGTGNGGGDDSKKEEPPAAKAGTEMTITLPRMVTDHMGKWVFNPWGVTFGKVWEDTRFAFAGDHWLPWIMQDYYPKGDYRMEKLHGTVCQGKSTIVNYPKIYNWFPRYIDTNKRNHRNILLNLRREIYTDGRSESCHTKDLDDWYEYQQCAILRDMRVDYLVPNYPLHRWYKTV